MAEKETKAKRTRKKAKVEAPVEVVEETKVEDAVEAEPEQPKKDAEKELLKEQNKLLMEEIKALKEKINSPQVIQISNDTEMIDFLWLAPVSDENELLIGDGTFGKITGKVGNFAVPKKDLSRVLDSSVRKYIEKRWLIVLGGMNKTERQQYGVDYRPGEVLDKDIFIRLFDYGEKIIPIYKDLCDASKDVVAKLYYEAWMTPQKKTRVARKTVVAMQKISPRPALKAILDEMNIEEAG